METTTYRGHQLVNIPSGLGGVLPAVIAGDNDADDVQVICLHEEFYPNWLLTVPREQIKPMTRRLNDRMKQIIDSRLAA